MKLICLPSSILVFFLFFLSRSLSVAQSLNYTDLNQFWQEFQSGVAGGYGTKILRLSSTKLKNTTISNYVAQWQNNRCILRAIATAEADEMTYNPNTQEYTFTIATPQGGRAIFKFAYNSQGFLRFTGYTTQGNITCPIGTENNTNLYTRQDLIGTWQLINAVWLGKPDHIRHTNDAEAAQAELEKKIAQAIIEKPILGSVSKISFDNNYMNVEMKEGIKKYLWRLSYNQLHIRNNPNEEWQVFATSWRIAPDGNFNLTWYDYNASDRTSIKWVFSK